MNSQGWDARRTPQGDVTAQQEYRTFPEFNEALSRASKSGGGAGTPDLIVMDREAHAPLTVIEAKRSADDIEDATVAWRREHAANPSEDGRDPRIDRGSLEIYRSMRKS